VQHLQERAEEPDRRHEKRRHNHAEVNAIDQRAVAIFALAAPKACATKVSKPISKPPPKKATTLKMPELMLTARWSSRCRASARP